MPNETSAPVIDGAQAVRYISLEYIADPAEPMRTGLDQAALMELAESIRQQGLINPITVRPKGDKFEVVAGHRRFRACAIAGKFRIPCVVMDIGDEQAFDIMAAENLNRQDVDPVEEALFLGRLIGEDENKIPEVAKRLNRSQQWVEERLELLTFSEKVLTALKQGQIKLGVAQWLGRVDEPYWQDLFVDQAIGQGMSVLQARFLHDQYHMGIYPKPGDIMPSNSELKGGEAPKVRVQCAKCGQIAEEPNIKNVFIHAECPLNVETTTAVPVAD